MKKLLLITLFSSSLIAAENDHSGYAWALS